MRRSATRSRRGRLGRSAAVALGLALGLTAGVAAAASLGATGGTLDAGVVAASPGCTGTPNVARLLTSYSPLDGYRVDTVSLNSVGADCRSPDTYVLTIADGTESSPKMAEWSGTAPDGASGDLSAPSPADGAPVDFVNPEGNDVGVFYLTESP
jgi:hypothetical protein